MSYVIFTDSACDIPAEKLADWGVSYCELRVMFDGEDRDYANSELNLTAFYKRMRDGGVARTSAANTETFKALFEPTLKAGRDVVYIGFSSGLSTTYQCSMMAADELREAYPERKLVTIDSLCASSGQGLLVYLAVRKKREGASMEELEAYLGEIRGKICHWFTVDDLVYLKRGGRVSAASAAVGTLLNIKPVLHVDDEGHLIAVSKVQGRKKSLRAIAEEYGRLALSKTEGPVFISHGDCLKDAKQLEKMLADSCGAHVDEFFDIGPVIGAHSGPGTLALFFLGEHR